MYDVASASGMFVVMLRSIMLIVLARPMLGELSGLHMVIQHHNYIMYNAVMFTPDIVWCL